MEQKVCPMTRWGNCIRNDCAWWVVDDHDHAYGMCAIKSIAISQEQGYK